MKIKQIEIGNFRNLNKIEIQPSTAINLLYGKNGSGKTSFLEAIHYLGLGRSFRTRQTTRVIQEDAAAFSIFAQLAAESGATLQAGVERNRNPSHLNIKINGQTAHTLVELAELLPLILIDADSHLLFSTGPITRRQQLDWGVFHVERPFFAYWQRANRTLKQRNAHLKYAQTYEEIAVWDEELCLCSAQLERLRQSYTQSLSATIQPMLETLLGRHDIQLEYYSGWNTNKSLEETLNANFHRDRQLGYTQQGPHRADMQLKIKNVPAYEVLSQGQQKLAAYALRICQGQLLQQAAGKTAIFLIDDLPSELDQNKRQLIASSITSLNLQTFITGIEASELLELFQAHNTKRFHVEQGLILDDLNT